MTYSFHLLSVGFGSSCLIGDGGVVHVSDSTLEIYIPPRQVSSIEDIGI